MLSAALPSCNSGTTKARLYRYTIDLLVDGRPYRFENSGRFRYFDSGFATALYKDYPMQSAARLPTGEVVLVRPPNMRWALEAQLPRGEWGSPVLDALVSAPYLTGQRPRAYIFNDPEAPTSMDAYLMPVAFDPGRSRIEFVGQSNELVDDESWTSQRETFPWYASCELEYRGYGGYSTDTSPRQGQLANEPLRAWDTWIARLIRQPGGDPLTASSLGLPASFEPQLAALEQGETVYIPLEPSPDGSCTLSLAPNPVVARAIRTMPSDVVDIVKTRCGIQTSPGQIASLRPFFFSRLASPLLGDMAFDQRTKIPGTGLDAYLSADGRLILAPIYGFPISLAQSTSEAWAKESRAPGYPNSIYAFQYL